MSTDRVGTSQDHRAVGHYLEISVVWEALARDSGCAVGVVDAAGQVRYLNRVASLLFLGREGEMDGAQPLADVAPAAFAQERVQVVQRCLALRAPVTLLSMVRGLLHFVTYRPLSAEAGLALVTAYPAALVADRPELLPRGEVVRAEHNDLGALSGLTEREMELLHHIGMGRSSEEAAQLMHRSTRTVEWHRASLGEKLGCENRVQLARIAQRCGLTAVDLACIRELHRSGRRRGARAPAV
jgi:DNA-binding CsgD family transcriptional regulator